MIRPGFALVATLLIGGFAFYATGHDASGGQTVYGDASCDGHRHSVVVGSSLA